MKNLKKSFVGILVICLVVASTFVSGIPFVSEENVYASTSVYQGKCGDNAFYKYDVNKKTLTISGKGEMWDDYNFASTFTDAKKVVIESGIESIGSYSFQDINLLDEVVIPETVKTIKENAFAYILNTVVIPRSVTKIEKFAFSGVEKFVFKGDINGYDTSALAINGINEIVLYGAAPDLGKALYGVKPKTITIAQENTKCRVSNGCLLSADGKQLYYCISSRDKIVVPDSVEVICTAAFVRRKIDELTLGKNVTKINEFAFENVRIGTLNINRKLNSVGVKAFYGTKLKNITLSSKVKLGVSSLGNKVKIRYTNKFKQHQTTVDTALVGKSKYNIKFAKISGAKGYQINVKKGKKTYKYFTVKNSFTKKAPKVLTREYNVKKDYDLSDNAYLKKVSGAAYVTARPYRISKGKKIFGRWSLKTVLSINQD